MKTVKDDSSRYKSTDTQSRQGPGTGPVPGYPESDGDTGGPPVCRSLRVGTTITVPMGSGRGTDDTRTSGSSLSCADAPPTGESRRKEFTVCSPVPCTSGLLRRQVHSKRPDLFDSDRDVPEPVESPRGRTRCSVVEFSGRSTDPDWVLCQR